MFNILNHPRVIICKTMNDFSNFLNRENAKRNWKDSDLARIAKVGKSSISWARSMGKPGPKVSRGIARAYKISVEEVYREAGLLPPAPRQDSEIDGLIHDLSNPIFTPEDIAEFRAEVRLKIELREGRNAAKGRKGRGAQRSEIIEPF